MQALKDRLAVLESDNRVQRAFEQGYVPKIDVDLRVLQNSRPAA